MERRKAAGLRDEQVDDPFFARPQVAQLLGITNIFKATVEDLDPAAGTSRLRCQGLLLTAGYLPGRLRGDRVGFCVPASQVHLGEGSLHGQLTHQILSPSTARLFFRLEDTTLDLECEVPRSRAADLSIGRRYALQIPPAAIHVFPVA